MNTTLSTLELQICSIQGRLFELAVKTGLNCYDFIGKFMNSQTASFLDLPYDRLQWAGEEYILETVLEECPVNRIDDAQKKQDPPNFTIEEAFWAGYVYRCWHFYTGENSKTIYQQADARIMRETYLGFHTLDVRHAIENLQALHHG